MTLGLSIITNDSNATISILKKYGQYFDKFFVTVADKDKKAYSHLKTYAKDEPKLNVTYFKWCDDFAAARNFNKEQIDTDYWLWIDDDDSIEYIDRLPELLRFMQTNDLDVVQLKYDYAQNEQGHAVSDHWRERLIRTGFICNWDAPVHETLQSKVPGKVERTDAVAIKHVKDPSLAKASMERNTKILLKHYEETLDPRDAYYLGMGALAEKRYEESIQWFIKHISTSGSDEDKYRSWCRIADCEWILGRHEQALYASDEAIKLRPAFPDAYFIKVAVYTTLEEYGKGIEWLKVGLNKPVPDTLNVVDPTLYQYRGMAMGAQCFLFSGRVKEAFKLYQEVERQAEGFFKSMNADDGVDWDTLFEDAYYDQKAIDYTKFLLYFLGTKGGDPKKIFQALPPKLVADVRLNPERAKFLPKTEWPEKSIAIYCGPSTEAWGPDTLDNGMGGSEEAVVYLSRELAKKGWQVTVFNDREEQYSESEVHYIDEKGKKPSLTYWDKWDHYRSDRAMYQVDYKPWTLLNPDDKFNTFIAWRAPENIRGINAKQKVIDLHDTIQPERIYQAVQEDPGVKIFVKSNYHRELYPDLPDEHFVVIGNGIEKGQFV